MDLCQRFDIRLNLVDRHADRFEQPEPRNQKPETRNQKPPQLQAEYLSMTIRISLTDAISVMPRESSSRSMIVIASGMIESKQRFSSK